MSPKAPTQQAHNPQNPAPVHNSNVISGPRQIQFTRFTEGGQLPPNFMPPRPMYAPADGNRPTIQGSSIPLYPHQRYPPPQQAVRVELPQQGQKYKPFENINVPQDLQAQAQAQYQPRPQSQHQPISQF